MASSNEFGSSSSGSGRKRPHRHSDQQTQRLEAYFRTNQHPNERERCQLGREVGLTATQIKFWFQNKRTLTKAQSGRVEGNALRQENERLKCENLAMIEALKDGLCMPCKGLVPNKAEQQRMNSQLKAENEQLKAEFARLSSILAQAGVPIHEKIQPQASSASVSIPLQGIGLTYSNLVNEPTWEQRSRLSQEFDIPRLAQMARAAIEELTALLTVEQLWIKDPNDGRLVIDRNKYEKGFMRNSHLSSSNTRFESSKEDAVVRMRGPQLVTMLQNSSRRLDLFPTIITNATTMHQQAGTSCCLQLVSEQIHILSPLVAPREFDLLRYSEQVDIDAWIIVDVSHNLRGDDNVQTSPFRAWKFPSGCLVKDLANGFSKVSWMEHIEVDDKASTHPLYRDIILGNLGYGAQRWISTLQRTCERFSSQMGESSLSKEVETITNPQGRKSVMNLTERMMKNFFASLSVKSKTDASPSSQQDNSETRLNIYKNTGPGLPTGMIISATTSLWIPFSYQAVFSFFTNSRKRYQWDAISNGNQIQEIVSITYGNDLGNRVSIMQPNVAGDPDTLLVQESCVDLHGGIIVYAPMHRNFLDMILNGEDSSTIPILASGFIITSDGNAKTAARDGASSSSAPKSGSILTVVQQILPPEKSTSDQISTLISSTIQKIKLALNGASLE